MLIAIAAVATVLIVAWVVLLCMANNEDWAAAAYDRVLENRIAAVKLLKKDREKAEKLAQCRGIEAAVMKLFLGGNSGKETAKLEKQSGQLQNGQFGSLNPFIMPGYVLQRKFSAIGRGWIYKTILTKNFELYGKKHAENKTKRLLAAIISYPIIGAGASLSLGAILMAVGAGTIGAVVAGIGTVLVLAVCYAMYDEVSDQAKKRHEKITRQFPNVVSKLALLVTSGMIVDRAWRETAFSQELELYIEMRRTTEELEQNVPPEAAYGNFINRCNTKETEKLASAILQSLAKGNAEIGALLKGLAKESWQERRHLAKRDSEKANSKLMIPTMMLFLAILVMIMVPIALQFGAF